MSTFPLRLSPEEDASAGLLDAEDAKLTRSPYVFGFRASGRMWV
jgi:hypothetical protein